MDTTPEPLNPVISMWPDVRQQYADAVEASGLLLSPLSKNTTALIVSNHPDDSAALESTLAQHPAISWVQFPMAGTEAFTDLVRAHHGISFTSAKGLFKEPVAEHALTLLLAALRDLKVRFTAQSWDSQQSGTSLFRRKVGVIGAGGIAQQFIELLAPFDCHVTVFRNSPTPTPGASQTFATSELKKHIPQLDALVIAAPLTQATQGLINAEVISLMQPSAVLVNISRGKLVDTEAITHALTTRAIHAYATDVTDPEPLPDGHLLWQLPNALITPHTADTEEMIVPLVAQRISRNTQAFLSGEPLEGVISPETGY